MSLIVRPAREDELDAVGALTVEAYEADDGTTLAHEPTLRDVRARARAGVLLVAERDGLLVGTVTLVRPGSVLAEIAEGDEAEVRALATAPAARGGGVGEALMRACAERALEDGAGWLVCSTSPAMHAAHRLCFRLGFVREADRDWAPVPDAPLLVFALDLG